MVSSRGMPDADSCSIPGVRRIEHLLKTGFIVMTVFSVLFMTLLVASAGQSQRSPLQKLSHVTNILNPRFDSAATLEIQEWNGKESLQVKYDAIFQGQDNLLLRKIIPAEDRGRSI